MDGKLVSRLAARCALEDLKCKKCMQCFSSFGKLLEHFRNNPYERYHCLYCDAQFVVKSFYQEHLYYE
jgi:hypothetical protein